MERELTNKKANNLLPKKNERLEKKIKALQVKLGLPSDQNDNNNNNNTNDTSSLPPPSTGRNKILDIINTAGEKELCKLHTVGTKRAKLIIQFRKDRPYDSFDDLKRAGFTTKILETFLKQNVFCNDDD